jgi:hypothetical protein
MPNRMIDENEAINAAKAAGQAEYQEPSDISEYTPDEYEGANDGPDRARVAEGLSKDPMPKAKVAPKKPVDRARTAPKKAVQTSPLAEPDEAYEGPTALAARMAEADTEAALGKRLRIKSKPYETPKVNPKDDAIEPVAVAEMLIGGGALAKAAMPAAKKAAQGVAAKAKQIKDKVIGKVDYALDYPARRAARKATEKAEAEAARLKWQKTGDDVSNAEGMRLVRKGVEESNAKRDLGPVTSIKQTRPQATVIRTNPVRKKDVSNQSSIRADSNKYVPTDRSVNTPASTFNKPLLPAQKKLQPKIAEGVNRPTVTEATRIAAQTAAKKVAAKKYPDRPGNVIKHNR